MTETPMTIDKARAVLWLRNNHRPLGELLDEGFLTRGRLEWAAENAYDGQLKRAAAVLLECIDQEAPVAETEVETAPPALDAGMSIKEARAVAWPFASHKGQPMGELVDGEQRRQILLVVLENERDRVPVQPVRGQILPQVF